jgi:hypothetical protein
VEPFSNHSLFVFQAQSTSFKDDQSKPTGINRFHPKKIGLLFPLPTRNLCGKSGKMGLSQPWKLPQKKRDFRT